MNNALYIAATGMQAEQQQLDTIANNLANVNTPAFKKSRASFKDLLYQQVSAISHGPSAQQNQGTMGLGSALSQVEKIYTNGELKATENPMDLAIQGQGFFEVQLENGSYGYTRVGELQILPDGVLATRQGLPLTAAIQIPEDASKVVIDDQGEVKAQINHENEWLSLGRIELVTFTNPAALEAYGDHLAMASEQSGQPIYHEPGQGGAGILRQGYTESSNVDLTEELLAMVMAQRAYEVNSQVIRAADEMMQISNNLRR